MNKKIKKLVAVFLITNTILNYWPCHSTFAVLSADEKRLVDQIERVRHEPECFIDWDGLSDKIKDESTSTDFKLYCLSLAFKCEHEACIKEFSKILSTGKELFLSPFLSMVLYRMKSRGDDNEIREFIPNSNDIFKYVESELTRFIETPNRDVFDYRCILCLLRYIYTSDYKVDKIRPLLIDLSHKDFVGLKILSLLSVINGDLDDVALSNALRRVNLIRSQTELKKTDIDKLIAFAKIPCNTEERLEILNLVIAHLGGIIKAVEIEKGREALIVLGKIPGRHQETEGVSCLLAIINHLGGNEVAAETDQGREALIALGKIPHDIDEQREALEAVITYFGGIENAAETDQGREALIALGKIPFNTYKQLEALDSVITHFGGIKNAVKTKQGRKALIVLGKIPGRHQKTEGISGLLEVIAHFGGIKNAAKTEQGREALIALGKIPGNIAERLKVLESIITHFGGIKNAAETEQGREVLIVLGKIPHNTYECEALEAVITHFGGITKAVEAEQGREAVIVLSKIPGSTQETEGIRGLLAIINHFGGIEAAVRKEQGREALIALGKIPHDTDRRLEALEAVIKYFGGITKAVETGQGREVLIALGKIPHKTEEQHKALEAVITHFGGNEAAARKEQGREALIALGKIPHNTAQQLEVLESVINYFDNRNTLATNPLSVMERAFKNRQGEVALKALRNVLIHCGDKSKKYLLRCIDQVVGNNRGNRVQRGRR